MIYISKGVYKTSISTIIHNFVKSFKVLILFISVFVFTNCSPKIAINYTDTLTPLSIDDKIALLDENHELPNNTKKIGDIRYQDSGFSVKCGFNSLLKKAEEEARKSGANIVKVIEKKRPDLWSGCYRLKVELHMYNGDVSILPQHSLHEDTSQFQIALGNNNINAKIIKNNNDTIFSKIRIKTNMFNSKLIDVKSILHSLILVDDKEKRYAKIRASEIKRLEFTDFKYQERTFVNDGNQLQELVYDGNRIKWMHSFSVNSYDGSIIIFNRFVNEKGVYTANALFRKSIVNNLKKATESKPNLINENEETNLKDEDILRILMLYDELE